MTHSNDLTSSSPVFSFILPAYNEVMNVEIMTNRLLQVGESIGETFEIIWINDGSTDGTDAVLDTLAENSENVRIVHLARNFGHMAALSAGLESAHATGAAICLDADGQHPPELIPDMITKWKNGADIVQMIRIQTSDASFIKQLTSPLFYHFINTIADIELDNGAADFRLMDREVVDAVNNLPERVRFLRGLIYWVGFQRETIPYDAPPRMGGTTKYSFYKMLLFALAGITTFSNKPLRISFLVGILVTMGAACYAGYILFCFFFGIHLVPGWTSLLLAILGLSGIQLISIGIASEYLGHIYQETKHRPVYLIRKRKRKTEK